MTRKNRTIRQSAERNSYSRETRPMPPQRSRAVAKESSSDPESLPAAISWRTGRNSSSRWNAIPSETQTNVEAMRLRRSGEAANSFAEFEPCTQWPYSSWTRRLSSSPGHGRAALRSSVVAKKISREWSVRVSRPYAAPDGVEFAKYGGGSMISVEEWGLMATVWRGPAPPAGPPAPLGEREGLSRGRPRLLLRPLLPAPRLPPPSGVRCP